VKAADRVNPLAPQRINREAAGEQRGDGRIAHIEPAGIGAERRQQQACTVANKTAPPDAHSPPRHDRRRMQMAGDLAFLSRRHMAEHQSAERDLRRHASAQPRRRLRIVIALHPDPFRARRHVGQRSALFRVQAARRVAVVKRIAQRDDPLWCAPRDDLCHTVDRRARVVRRQQAAALRVSRAFLEMQIGEHQRLLGRPNRRAGFIEQQRFAVHKDVQVVASSHTPQAYTKCVRPSLEGRDPQRKPNCVFASRSGLVTC